MRKSNRILKGSQWKRECLVISVMLVSLFWTAQGDAWEELKPKGFKLSISKMLRFGGGLLTGFVIHEAGHVIAMEAKGRDWRWEGSGSLHFRYEGESDTCIQMAGLMAGALSSEAILLIPREKREAYLNGVLMFNVLNGFCYPVFRHTGGDFKSLSHGERWTWGSIFVAHSLLTSYRIYRAGHLNFRTWVGATEKGTPMMGFRITW